MSADTGIGRRPQGQIELFKALAADVSQAGVAVREKAGGVRSGGFILECPLPPVGKPFEDKAILLFAPSQPRAGIRNSSLALTIISFKPLGSEAQFAGQLLRETWASGVSLMPDGTLATFRKQTIDEVLETNIMQQPGRYPAESPIFSREDPGVILGEMDQIAPVVLS